MKGTPTDEHVVAPSRLGSARVTDRIGAQLQRGVPDRVVLLGLLALGAVLRFPFRIPGGTWDADQGHDMLVLRGLVVDGVIPLLGPPTSIGDFHHGAAYYYLLAPFAFVSAADPAVVIAGLALAGTLAVAVTWWLARMVGGSVAAAIAGLLIAVSPSAIEASTFLWNPNAITLTAGLALAGAWRALVTGHVRWWALAAVAVGLTMQLHVLGVGLFVPIAGLFVWAWVRAGTSGSATAGGPTRRRLMGAAVLGLALIVVQYVPLAIHELSTDFSETRAVLAYFAAETQPDALDPVSRILLVLLRIVSWPVVGLITEAAIPGLVVAFAVVGIIVWCWRAHDRDEAWAVRWFGFSIAWSTIFLAIAGRGLGTVVPGLPNDHYHAFVDPMIFSLIGIGLAAVARGRERRVRLGGRSGRVEDRLATPSPAAAPGSRVSVGGRTDFGGGRTGFGGGRTGFGGRPGSGGALEPSSPGVVRPDTTSRTVVALIVAITVVVSVGRWPPATATDGGWPAAEAAGARILGATTDRTILLAGLPRFKSTEAYAFPLTHAGAQVIALTGPDIDDEAGPGPIEGSAALVIACDRLFESVLLAQCGGDAEPQILRQRDTVSYVLVDRFAASWRTVISVYLPAGS